MRDVERRDRLRKAIESSPFDAIVCALPMNVLMMTRYWPVVSTAIAILARNGTVILIAPEDERAYWTLSDADSVLVPKPTPNGTVDTLVQHEQTVFTEAIHKLGLLNGNIGIETSPESVPATYIAMTVFQSGLPILLHNTSSALAVQPADELLADLRSSLTMAEIDQVRTACAVAQKAYTTGKDCIRIGLIETRAAQYFQVPLWDPELGPNMRADGRVSCMSGIRSGSAFGSFAMSSNKQLEARDLVLMHCNSQVNGFWTDITRTYHLGKPSERVRDMYEALFAARQAGFETIRNGVHASEVDRAVREVLISRGYESAIHHPVGHGVGYSAINHRAQPRLAVGSSDILKTGMVMNIEPGLYFPDFGGMRHCDMVCVTESGFELLTPFHTTIADLICTE